MRLLKEINGGYKLKTRCKNMNNKKIVELCYGIRIDSGANHSDFLSTSQYQPIVFPPMDAQKRSDNIVVKLTNVNNLLNERVKFTKLKKNKKGNYI